MLRPEGTTSIVRALINAGLTQVSKDYIIMGRCFDMNDHKKEE